MRLEPAFLEYISLTQKEIEIVIIIYYPLFVTYTILLSQDFGNIRSEG